MFEPRPDTSSPGVAPAAPNGSTVVIVGDRVIQFPVEEVLCHILNRLAAIEARIPVKSVSLEEEAIQWTKTHPQ